nr:HlyD family efflux transporter periplasmic adaptor subunit [Sulfurovaceae bacterium]
IGKKSIKMKNQYLYKISVRAGDFVNPSSPLAVVQDQSRAKLTLFLEPDEIKNIHEKKIYIDGEETDYRLDKIWNSADEKYISLYRAEIYIESPKKRFSTLVKVELK